MNQNNSKQLELLVSDDFSLDKNTPIDQQIVDYIDQLFIDLDQEDYDDLIISIFDILDHQLVESVLIALEKEIAKKYTREPDYPIMARIKTCILYFFTGNGNLSNFHRELILKQLEWGGKLGYHQLGYGYWLPAYPTLHEFLRDYLGPAIYNNFDTFVKIVMQIAHNYELRPGWRSIVDSTPHESTPNDDDAGYSGHYEINGYKEHRLICADLDIPFSFKVTKANEYDGDQVQELIEKAEKGNAAIAELWFDQHYTSFENLSYYELVKGIKTHFRIAENWKIDETVTKDEIHRMYQKLWKHDDFLAADDPNCTIEFQLKFIWEHSSTDTHRKAVGKYLRNKAHKEYRESPKQYLSKQGPRSKIEGGFGVEKLFSPLKLVTMRTMRSWKSLISLRNFIDLLISVFRMDIGQKTNITSWKGIIA